MGKPYQAIFSLMALCILVAATVLTMALISSPLPLAADAPETDFSAGRAMRDLAVIAREPHPMGVSQARATVRDYLLGEIRSLGLEPQVQKTFGLRVVHPGWVIAGAVENVLVRLPGTEPDGAILLMAHYDSAPAVPGAADNGSGVVTLLELLRALQARPPLRQDVIVFLTDGEEPGTIGAHAFVAQHPWFDDVALVINLDTVTSAPPILRRTSAGNGVWVQALARSVPRPAFASLPFHLFPAGDSDLLPFVQAGTRGADFSAMAGFPELHTASDQIEVVNPARVQHVGDQFLALVRHLGDQPTLDASTPDQTFFPVLGRLVHYPTGWAMPLAIAGGLCFVATVYLGFRTSALTWRGLGLSCLAFLVTVALSVGIANLLWLGIQALHPEYGYSAFRPHLSDDHLYALGLFALALAVSTCAIALARLKISALDLAAGAMVPWLPVAIAAAILVPMTSYLASWGLLAGSLALVVSLSAQARQSARATSGLGFLISAILAAFLWVPVIYVAYLAGFPLLSMIVGLVALWLGSTMPILDWIATPQRWLLPVAAALTGTGFLLAGHFVVGKSSPPPIVNPIGYWLDAEEDEAYWIAFSEKLDARQTAILTDPERRLYTEIFPAAPRYPVLTSAAPTLDLAGPDLKLVEDRWMGDRRVTRVRLATSMHDRLYLIVPGDVPVLALTLPHNERRELPPCDEGFVLRFDGMPVEGFEMQLELGTMDPLQFLLVEERTGLPSFPGLSTQPLPGTMRTPGEFYQGIPTDYTAVNRSSAIQGVSARGDDADESLRVSTRAIGPTDPKNER